MEKILDNINSMSDEDFASFWENIKKERTPGAGEDADEYCKFLESMPLKKEVANECPTISFKLNQMGLDLIYKIINDKQYCDNGSFSFNLNTNNTSAYNYLCH